MRCPKCQYISFEGGGRCRNCGYELSLAPEPADLDLPIKTGNEPVGPLADFELEPQPPLDLPPVPPRRGGQSRSAETSGEFPLFRGVEGGDRSAVSPPIEPRPPVAVRKPEPSRRPDLDTAEEPELDLDDAPPVRKRVEAAPRRRSAAAAPRPDETAALEDAGRTASIGARLGAALVDLLLLGAIDGGVLYLTLRLTGVELSEIRILPVIPFSAFLALLNGGYLVVLTVAGGQTLGKMATGIKVINADPEAAIDRVPLAQAVVRAAALLVSVVPVGLGFLPALLAADRRALHDRIAGTRVIHA
jgi:uncharacterized RDD family membrane protein YckC